MNSQTKNCRHGILHFQQDEFVGRSLANYGEYRETEVKSLCNILRKEDTIIEIGAGIGAMTVPLSRAVDSVVAVESDAEKRKLLEYNTVRNMLANVVVCDKCPEVENVSLIKINESEIKSIDEIQTIINKFRPIIYVNYDVDDRKALVTKLVELNYRCFLFRSPLWNKDNFTGSRNNQFGTMMVSALACVPEEKNFKILHCDEVADLRGDEQMYEREIERFSRIVSKYPDDLDARLKLAHFHMLMQHDYQANLLTKENLRRDPDHIMTHHMCGLHALQLRNWKDGWAGYEYRYKKPNSFSFGDRPHKGERWDGTPTDKPLLIWSEQGFGDSVMFARFWKRVKAIAPNAFMEVQPQLYELFKISGIEPLYRRGRTLPEYELHCSLPSLPYVLGCNTSDSLRHAPYLMAEPSMSKIWCERDTSRIGFCWAGSHRSERPYTRDIDPDLFLPLTAKHGIFLSLMQEGNYESFADTAAAISSLDLIITVDTAVAHLAGAMGIETWLLLSFDPDWRWGFRSERSVWYDHMRIFRQPKLLDWKSVVAEIDAALDQRLMLEAAE